MVQKAFFLMRNKTANKSNSFGAKDSPTIIFNDVRAVRASNSWYVSKIAPADAA